MTNRNLFVLIASLIGFCGVTGATAEENNVNSSWTSITVGVADLDEALNLWAGTFGFEIRHKRQGPDEQLARLWSIEADDINSQALVATPGQSKGLIHLVQFNGPEPPVRQGAQVFDLCPKNLDIYVADMPRQHPELIASGHSFRTDTFSDLKAPNGIHFREIHLPAHDKLNVVLLEIVGKELPFNSKGYAGVGPLITIVADAGKEKEFYRNIIGLSILSDNILDGLEIEKMIGLPSGAALDVSIWGAEDSPMGQVEIIDYRGVEGNNLYPKARPKSLGILHISYAAKNLAALQSKLDQASIGWTDHGTVETLPFRGHAMHFYSPAGLRIEAYSE